MIDVPHTCTNCALRHGDCSGEYFEQQLKTDDCPEFVIGKCFICKHTDAEEETTGLCVAGDMSGFGCPNFAE